MDGATDIRPAGRPARALAAGLRISVAMWSVGFFGRLPQASLPAPLLLLLLAAAPFLGGRRAGRHPGAGVTDGAAAGLVAGGLNLLVLGGLLGEAEGSASAWGLAIAGSFAAVIALGAAGAALGRRMPREEIEPTASIAKTAAVATLLLVLLGGLVTSQDAGLAVVDWPNSYGYPMFLFPLGRMIGGVFYEHAHRLFGSLVGLATLLLALRLFATGSRGGVRQLGTLALLLVVGQGILGGLRVTGHFTWSDSPEVTRPSLLLAMVHGVTGQVFCALMAALAAITSRTWRTAPRPGGGGSGGVLPGLLVATLLLQLLLGVRLRHLGEGVMVHITGAVLVLAVGMAAAVRVAALHDHVPVLRRLGRALLAHLLAQLLLGGVALLAVQQAVEGGPRPFEVIAATAHQTVGAALLANAVLLAMWSARLLPAAATVPPRPEVAADRSPG